MERENSLSRYLDRHVFNRLRTTVIFSLVYCAVTIYFVVALGFGVPLAALSFLIGLVVGVFLSRMYKLSWDSETNQIVSNIDRIGILIFIIYLIFNVGRFYLVGRWVHGSSYFGVIFAITAGVMVGRLFATRHTLQKLKQDLFDIRKKLS